MGASRDRKRALGRVLRVLSIPQVTAGVGPPGPYRPLEVTYSLAQNQCYGDAERFAGWLAQRWREQGT